MKKFVFVVKKDYEYLPIIIECYIFRKWSKGIILQFRIKFEYSKDVKDIIRKTQGIILQFHIKFEYSKDVNEIILLMIF